MIWAEWRQGSRVSWITSGVSVGTTRLLHALGHRSRLSCLDSDSSTPPCIGFQLCHVLPIMLWISHLLLYNKWLQILQPKAIHIYCLKVSAGQGSGHSFLGAFWLSPVARLQWRCQPTCNQLKGKTLPLSSLTWLLLHFNRPASRLIEMGVSAGPSQAVAAGSPPEQVTLRQRETGHPRWESWLFTTESRLMNFAAFWFIRSNSINPANSWEEGITPEPPLCTEMGRWLGPCESLPTTWFSPTDLAQGLWRVQLYFIAFIRKLVLSFCKRLAHYEDKNTAKQCDRLYQKSFNTPHEENNNYDFFCVILELITPSVPFNSHSSNCTFPLSWFVS